ncbi:MAG: N-acetylneuraminate synthase family protein [Candidatus Omnitrophota bacterium]
MGRILWLMAGHPAGDKERIIMGNIMKIGGRKVGPGQPVFVIAEIGLNHHGDMKTAKRLIDSAARAGVDAVKFQTYITEKRTFAGSPIFDILRKCELPFSCFKELKDHAARKGVIFFSTPFDEDSLAYLEKIKVPCYKVASFDVVNHKFLKQVAATGKPVILSVGMSDLKEIKAAYKILSSHTQQVALLHCISAYPTEEKDANLSAIALLKDAFDGVVRQSDHTADIVVPLYAVAAGARIIEKHYKIDDQFDCVDAPVSITQEQMQNLVIQIKRVEGMLGAGSLGVRHAEKGCKVFRRHAGLK